MKGESFKLEIFSSIEECDGKRWNELVPDDNPFVKYEFFSALERGKCIGAQTSWHPKYFILSQNGAYKCAFFTFVKFDSYGEFIFDWEWARAFQQYQVPYYPKLTTAIPFSPVTAPKFLGCPHLLQSTLLPKVLDFYKDSDTSSLHLLFTSEEEQRIFNPFGLKERDSFQYHWHNHDYSNFDDFLQKLKKNRRKSIKRERRSLEHLTFKELTGDQVSEEDLTFFYQSYLSTIHKKQSQAYLNYDFFLNLFKGLPDNTILLQAFDPESGELIANALLLNSQTRLYGRYWGCSEEVQFLHFELCLYRGLDIAIRKKLDVFEAGAQGEHKRLRGFTPIINKSLHHIKHPGFADAIYEFLEREKSGISQLFKEFESVNPYKKID